jgi:hypothetical protein
MVEIMTINHSINESVYAEQLALLHSIQDKVPWSAKSEKQPHDVLAKLKGVQLFSKFGSALVRTGSSSVDFSGSKGLFDHAKSTAHSLNSGFSFAALAFSIYDFVRIPLTYIVAWQLGQKTDLSDSQKARWLYSGFLLGLSITAIALPVTAVSIAVATAAIGLASSLFAIGRFFYFKHKLKEELNQIKEALEVKEKGVDEFRSKAAFLQKKLQEAKNTKNQMEIAALAPEIKQLSANYFAQINEVQSLKDKQYFLEQKLERKGMGTLLDKTVSVGLASIGLIGITLSLFFPPIGFGIVLGAVGAGLFYGVGRAALPLLTKILHFVRDKFNPAQNSAVDANDVQPQASLEKSLIHESTADVINELNAHPTVSKTSQVQQEISAKKNLSIPNSITKSGKSKAEEPVESGAEGEGERENNIKLS